MNKDILTIRNLSKTYSQGKRSETKALQDVSFTLHDNEITGLIGPNGAGKTTLLRIIMGFEKQDNGSVEFLQKSTLDLDVRNLIGYQSDLQFRGKEFSLIDYLFFHADVMNISNSNDTINNLLSAFSLNDAKFKKLTALSKGMRQKAELAVSFLNKPQLVVLDEPTAALDPPSVFELRDFIKNYRSTGATVLFSSHHLTEVEKICDRVIFIDSGKIVSDIMISEAAPGILEESFRRYESERRFV